MTSERKKLNFRANAAITLQKIDPDNQLAIDIFLEWFQSAEDALEQIYAKECLINTACGNPKAIDTLYTLIGSSQDEKTRIRASNILGIIARKPEREKAISAINVLLEQLQTTFAQNQIADVARYLAEIAGRNPEVTEYVVERLIDIIRSTQEEQADSYNLFAEERCFYAAYNLLSVAPHNQQAVKILLKLFCDKFDEIPFVGATDQFKKIGNNNLTIINAILVAIQSIDEEELAGSDDRIFWRLVGVIGEIAFGNQVARDTLIQRLEVTEDCWRRVHIAENLGKIAPGNSVAIQTLTELMQAEPVRQVRSVTDLRLSAAKRLGEIDPGNPNAIKTFIEILQSAKIQFLELIEQLSLNSETTCDDIWERQKVCARESREWKNLEKASEAARNLKRSVDELKIIAQADDKAITALTQILKTVRDQKILLEAAQSLQVIDPGNPAAVETLITLQLTNQVQGWLGYGTAVWYIQKAMEISDSNRKREIIKGLTRLVKNSSNERTIQKAAVALGKFDPGNHLAVDTLIRLLQSNKVYTDDLLKNIEETIQGKEWRRVLKEVVKSIKPILMQAHKNLDEGERQDIFEKYLEIVWLCAENLNYIDFFITWQNHSTTYHLKPKFLLLRIVYSVIWFIFSSAAILKSYTLKPQYLLVNIITLANFNTVV